MPADTPRVRRSARFVALLASLAIAAAGFVALGVWQLERLAWKEALIARVNERVHAAPVDAPGPAAWPALTRDDGEYRRVRASGRFEGGQVLVTASTGLGYGHWVVSPLRRDDGSWLLVNRGFVPADLHDAPAAPAGEAQVTGLLRITEPGGSFLRSNAPAQGLWYSRDVAAIAATLGLRGPVAPYFVDAQSVAAASAAGRVPAWPRPGLTVIQFPNSHLGYALTWFALAVGSAGAAGFLLHDERRRRRPAGARRLAVPVIPT